MNRTRSGPRHAFLPSATLLLCLISFAIVPLHALAASHPRKSIKQYVHDRWTTANGLPQNGADDMLQTRDGYLLFATQEGLARFDGVEFTVFDRMNSPGMTDSWMVRMLEDSTGGIWLRPVGFAPGIVRMSNGTFTAWGTQNGFPSNRILSWDNDHDGGTWIGTDRGLCYFKGRVLRTLTRNDGLPGDTVIGLGVDSRSTVWVSTLTGFARIVNGTVERLTGTVAFPDTVVGPLTTVKNIFEDSRGTVWMRQPHGVVAYAGGAFKRYTRKNGLSDDVINDIKEDRNGSVWFATNAGLDRYANGRFTSYRVPGGNDENTIFQICLDNEGSLWLATAKGLARFADGSFETYQQKDGLGDNTVLRILMDTEGSIWVSSGGGGVERFRDGKFVTYSSRVGLSYDMVQPLFEDHTGALWIGTSFGGLNRMKDGAITVYDMTKGLPGNDIRTLNEDGDGNLWISTVGGLCTYRNGSIVLRSHGAGNAQDVLGNGMARDASGHMLMGSRNRVYRFVDGKFENICTIDSLPNAANFITALFEGRDGVLWVPTRTALYWYKDGHLEKKAGTHGFPEGWVQAYSRDDDGTEWFTVAGQGVFRLRNGTVANITPRQGLFDYMAYTLIQDQFGYFWISCNKGVYRVKKSDLNDVADGKMASLTCDVFGTADGMESRECNGGWTFAGVRLRDGRIAFATVKGVTMVDPADIRINPIPPPVVIDRFAVEGEPQSIHNGIRIPPGKGRFEFHYAGLSFIGADKIHYKFRLDGLDTGWIDAGNRREASYTNLRPGNYTFRVIAANSDGVWNSVGASTAFELEPRFYQTSWFLGLALFIFLTSGPSFYYYRMRSIKRRKEELEHLVHERTNELEKSLNNLKETQKQLILSEKMASLGQLTAGIAHEIKNPLNFITNFAVISQELTQELRQELAAERDRVDPKRAEEITGILNDLEQNVTKINDHGKRADSIVRGMLLHSRGKPGERQDVDLNALLAEYTNLAYHGMRAQDASFNIKIETNLDPSVGNVNVVPQDLSRAFLNIVNNACYAANDRKKSSRNGFTPTVRVSARNAGNNVEIRIWDNGNGIPREILDRIFNPFFTTKPAGVGTGLGLSLSYDIITQVHNGEIRVDTKEGEGTEFILTIPRTSAERGGSAA